MKNIAIFIVFLITSSSTSVLCQVQGPIYQGDPMVNGELTQDYDVPWSENKNQQHTGVDYSAQKGQSVYATNNGTVTKVGNLGESLSGEPWGQYVVVEKPNGQANGFLHIVPSVQSGQKVVQGEKIGTVFNNHLHYNECVQSDGCQHGAFPSPTFKDKATSTMPNYYLKPDVFDHTNHRSSISNPSSAFTFKPSAFIFKPNPFIFKSSAFSFNQPNSSTNRLNVNNQNKK